MSSAQPSNYTVPAAPAVPANADDSHNDPDSSGYVSPHPHILHGDRNSWATFNSTITYPQSTTPHASFTNKWLVERATLTTYNHSTTPPSTTLHKIVHKTASGTWRVLRAGTTQDRPENVIIHASKPKWCTRRIVLTFSVEASQKESGREHVRERKFTLSRLRKASSTFVVREVTDVGERVLRAIENGEKLEDMESRKGEEKKKRSAPGVKVAEFVSDGYDKRTYTIAYDDALPPCLPAFGFWLVTIMNRRSSREDGPNSCSGVTWGGC